MKEKIKNLRLEIDAIALLLNTMKGMHLYKALLTDGVCIKNCQLSLFLSKAWLGKSLGCLGNDTPYKNDGKRKDVSDIEPTSDRATLIFKDDLEKIEFETMNYVEKIDYLRQKINIAGEKIKLFLEEDTFAYNEIDELGSYFLFSYKHISEARFHLGFELEQIREKSLQQHMDTCA